MRLSILSSIRAYGGGEKWILRAAECLGSHGVDVEVLHDPGGELGGRLRAAGLHSAPLELNKRSLLSGAKHLARALRDRRPDALICCNERAVRVAALARALPTTGVSGIPVVYRNGLEGSFKNKPLNRLLVNPRVDRHVGNADAIRRELLSFGWIPPERVRVIYNGVDPRPLQDADPRGIREEMGASAEDVVVLTAARLVSQKGHPLLLDAVARMDPATRPQFWIAGEGPDAEPLQRQLDHLGLARWVRLLGFRADVARLLRAADLLCHPSRREGAPNIVLEAMVAGLAVVALDASGTVELVDNDRTGLLSDVGDVTGLATNLQRLARDKALRERLGAAGRARALTEFTEERSMERWMDLLDEVVKGGPAPAPR
ncbi:MAG: glycosyltransferase family 4 protein [Actinomycetota bacterium]